MALPAKPQSTIIETPDIAVAKTIGKMTSKDITIEMLGNLDDWEDVISLGVLLSLGSDKELFGDGEKITETFLRDFAYTFLALSNSLRTKAGGIRSEQLVRITKQSDVMLPQQEGIISRIRGKFQR